MLRSGIFVIFINIMYLIFLFYDITDSAVSAICTLFFALIFQKAAK